MPTPSSAVTTSTILLFLVVTIIILVVVRSESEDPDPDSSEEYCSNKWIYIQQLPPQFNLDLLANCSEHHSWYNLCPYLSNHGLGLKTHNKTHSWYRTDPLMLELIFHRRILEYPCLTPLPRQANAVYLPYYAGLDSLKYLFGPQVNHTSRHGLDLFRHIQQHSVDTWNRNLGHDHFLVMARPAWDFTQPLSNDPPLFGTSFLQLPQFFNVTALTLEARAYPWQEMAIPYPTSFHPPNLAFFDSWINRVRRSRRTSLMLFAGGGGGGGGVVSANPNIRKSIRLECESSNATSMDGSGGYSNFCDFVDCSNGICEHDPIKFMRPMLQSSFCLQPPGDTPTRRSTFDGLLAGCIPVFFEEMSAKRQYGWHLLEEEYPQFSVFIPKEDVVFKGVKILDVLMGIPRAEVRRMRQKVIQMIPRIMYRKHGSSMGLRSKKDAFDIAIEGTLHRIKSRLEELAAFK